MIATKIGTTEKEEEKSNTFASLKNNNHIYRPSLKI